MTDEQIKSAIKNMEAYLAECYDDTDTVVMTANVLKSIKINYEELIEAKAEIERLKIRNDELNALNKTASIEAIKEFIKEHREIMMAFCDDDDQISLKVCEYDANTDNLVKEMVGETND